MRNQLTRRGFVGAVAGLGLLGCHEASTTRTAASKSPGVTTRDLGPMGTGSNMFRSGCVHSSGDVFIGTYGPAPGIVWKYDRKTKQLTKVAAPGEYQLDCMVEAPNGKIYIGTAYSGIVYELDPASGEVRNLGAPPVESEATWIFTMTRTRDGEIYGARGVGMFQLDWKTGKMESLGIVPGKHETPGVSSNPIVRNLQQRPDGLIWGDTNRWIFTFDPKTRTIVPVVDVAAYDEACYGIMHSSGHSPFDDLYFAIYARFNYRTPRNTLMVCRTKSGKLEPLDVPGVESVVCWPQGWWRGEDGKGPPRWVVTEYDAETQRASVVLIDVERRVVEARWQVEGNDTPPTRALDLDGPGAWFFTGTRGAVLRVDAPAKTLRRVATNPMPVEVRCLAAAPDGRLGADTYDCGFVFTFDPDTKRSVDHGRVYFDDHRCNWGPAAFAGAGDELSFVANHGENEKVVRLWATELAGSSHREIGEAAIQLVRMGDGSVCGTFGRNPPSIDFDPKTCWTPAWAALGGQAFRYVAGWRRVVTLNNWGRVGPIAPMPGSSSQAVVAVGSRLLVRDLSGGSAIRQELTLHAPILALATHLHARWPLLFAALADQSVVRLQVGDDGKLFETQHSSFGPTDRGFFVLPRSGTVIGVSGDGTVTVLEMWSTAKKLKGLPPLPAGPAVHPTRDAWYFAHRGVVEYTV